MTTATRQRSLKCLALLACISLVGCETDDGTTVRTEGVALNSPEALSGGEEATTVPTNDDTVPFALDTPSPKFNVVWEGEEQQSIVNSEALRFTVKNLEDEPIEVGVAVRFMGLIGKTAALGMGTLQLEGKGEETLAVKAEDIPIQTLSGVCHADVELVWEQASPEGPVKAKDTSGGRYYRHADGYREVMHFSQLVFLKDFEGIMTLPPGLPRIDREGKVVPARSGETLVDPKSLAGFAIGRILEEDGRFRDVRLMEPGSADASGGYVLGAVIGTGNQRAAADE